MTPSFSRRFRLLAPFVLLYMGLFGAMALHAGNQEFLFYGLCMLLLIAAVLWMDTRVRFSPLVLWGLAVWGCLHMAGGNLPVPNPANGGEPEVLYNFRPWPWFPKYDQIVHAFGFAAATLAAHESLRAAVGGRLRVTFGVAVALACVGMGLGAVNEIIEFAADRTLPSTNVGGYVNTGWDLVSNAAGAMLAAGWVWWRGGGAAE